MKHKGIAFVVCAVVSVMTVLNPMEISFNVGADNVSDLESEIAANEAAINEKREQMRTLEEEAGSASEYISALSEKMTLQQENIDIINGQITELETDINARKEDIAALEEVIAGQKADIDVNIEQFRERLRMMYISGSDSTAEVLTGATDFYDLLARTELVNRIAEHDDELIDNLNNQLDEYNKKNEELVQQKTELEAQQKNAEEKLDKLQGEMNSLIDEYTESQATLEKLQNDAALAQSDIDYLNNQNSELQSQIDYIKEQERIAAEKARQEAEERERQRQEELERQRQEQTQSEQSYSESESTQNIQIDYSNETYTGDRSAIIDYAKTYLGIYYQWCGNYPASGYYGLDCSHFTYRVLEHFGLMDYYMDSRGQCRYCTEISADELQPGDLIFYYSGGVVQHVNMYIGGGQAIGAQGGDSWVTSESSAESINAKVKIVSVDSDSRYRTYGRVPGMN